MKRDTFFIAILMVLFSWSLSMATVRKYSGTEVQNLIDTINALSAVAAQNETNMTTLLRKLDDDGGVTDTNYEASVSASTSAANTLRR